MPSAHGGQTWPAVPRETSHQTLASLSAQPIGPSHGTAAHVRLTHASTAVREAQAGWSEGSHGLPAWGARLHAWKTENPTRTSTTERMNTSGAEP
jgi:hypothetical protein